MALYYGAPAVQFIYYMELVATGSHSSRRFSCRPLQQQTCAGLNIRRGIMFLGTSRFLLVQSMMVAVALSTSAGIARAEAPYQVEWARQIGSEANDGSFSLAMDAWGNLYISGYTFGSLDGNTNAGRSDAFLTKYDPSGNKIWTRQIGTPGWDGSNGVTVDNTGNIYISGYTYGDLDGNTNAGVAEDAFLTKYDPLGNKLWTRQIGTERGDRSDSVATDTSGNIFISGYTRSSLDGNTHAGQSDAFLTKFDPSGNTIWSRQIGALSDDRSTSVVTDTFGNAYISGKVEGDLNDINSSGNGDAFISKYDPSGNEVWTRQIGSSYYDSSQSVAVDILGNVYISGATFGSFDGNTYAGSLDVFLAKYDSLGNKLWTRQFGTEAEEGSLSVVTDKWGDVYISGYTADGLDGSTPDVWDAFLIKYDPSGNQIWAQQIGTSGYDQGNAVIVDALGNLYLSGRTGGSLAGQIHAGDLDAFLMKFTIPEPASLALLAVGGLVLLTIRR
jgi:Beta-propeller repeat